MNTPLTISLLLLFVQAEIPLWLLVGMILLSAFIMCLQLYLAGKNMKKSYMAVKPGIREEQPADLLSGYPIIYLVSSRIKGDSDLKIIAMNPGWFPGQVPCPERSADSSEDVSVEIS